MLSVILMAHLFSPAMKDDIQLFFRDAHIWFSWGKHRGLLFLGRGKRGG